MCAGNAATLLWLAAAVGGFGAFAATVVFGVAGLLAGRYLDGKLDLSQFVGRDRDCDDPTPLTAMPQRNSDSAAIPEYTTPAPC